MFKILISIFLYFLGCEPYSMNIFDNRKSIFHNIKNNINSTIQIVGVQYAQDNDCSDENNEPIISQGSGFILNNDGYILTNYHVIENKNELYIGVSNSDDLKSQPQIIYIAKPYAISRKNDLALIKIFAKNKYYDLQRNFDESFYPKIFKNRFIDLKDEKINIRPFNFGNSSDVNIGDDIFVIGYPGLGGNTLTLTKGIVSGFTQGGSYIKTDTEINPGNSGGIALDYNFRIVGISTAAFVGDEIRGKIGLITPINKAFELYNLI